MSEPPFEAARCANSSKNRHNFRIFLDSVIKLVYNKTCVFIMISGMRHSPGSSCNA